MSLSILVHKVGMLSLCLHRPVENFTKTFFLRHNKLECLFLARHFGLVQYFWPETNVKNFFVRDLRIFVLSYSVRQTRLEKLTNNKHSSLLQKPVIYGQISFITLGPGPTVDCAVKHFLRILQCANQGQTLQLISKIKVLCNYLARFLSSFTFF